ncbi:zinc finger protein 2 [Sergentomyia squamirostris]
MTSSCENPENTTYLDELCRICSVKCSVLDIHVFSQLGKIRGLLKKLESCLSISVREHDPFPKKLCENCCFQLEAYYEFRMKSLESENYFNSLLKKSEESFSTDSFAQIDFDVPGSEPDTKERRENSEYILESDILITVEENGSQFNLTGNEIINFDQTMLSDTNIFNMKIDQKDAGDHAESLTMNSESLPSDLNFADHLTDVDMKIDIGQSDNNDESQMPESPSVEVDFMSEEEKTHEEEILLKKSKMKGKSKMCTVCQKTFQNNFKLDEHMLRHKDPKPYKCQYEGCKKGFQSKIGWAQHEASHKGLFLLTCDICGKGFQCQSYLTVHQRVHSDSRPFACSTCGERFKAKATLINHENRHKGILPFKCYICYKGFVTKALCTSHEATHDDIENNRKYPCEICQKKFVCKTYLKVHQRIHLNDRPFGCEICEKKFLTKTDLKTHLQTHTKEKKHFCEICGKNFARKDTLTIHKRSHSGVRPYKCYYCDDAFTQLSVRNVHMKHKHTGERNFACPEKNCSKKFVARSTMMTHLKRHNNHATDSI